MSECPSVPCPPFREVKLEVEAVCDCHGFHHPGNHLCPIHGDLVYAWLDGYTTALWELGRPDFDVKHGTRRDLV